MNDDSTKRARIAYEAFRGGLISGLDADVPRWEDAPNWIRDVVLVAYLQGTLDGPAQSTRHIQIGPNDPNSQREKAYASDTFGAFVERPAPSPAGHS